MRSLAAIVLAAGDSSRMGSETNKLLEPISGKPLLAWPVDAAIEAGISPVLVVTGFEADRVESILADRPVSFVRNSDWARGQSHSIAEGVRALERRAPDAAGVLVLLGDLPRLRASTLRSLIRAFEAIQENNEAENSIVAPVHRGQRGHPVLFGRRYFHELRADRTGHDASGARGIIERHPESLTLIEIENDGPTHDIDSPADLATERALESSR